MKPTYSSQDGQDVIQAQNLVGLADKFNDIEEASYASHMREPLDLGFNLKYAWPAHTNYDNITYGVATTGLDNAKDILAPKVDRYGEQDPAIINQYRFSHNNYAPGE